MAKKFAFSTNFLLGNHDAIKKFNWDESSVLIYSERDKNLVGEAILNFSASKYFDEKVQFSDSAFAPVLFDEGSYDSARGEISIFTSGTTGLPKLVTNKFSKVFKIKKNYSANWGCFFELSKFAGLQIYFQALLGGGNFYNLNSSSIQSVTDMCRDHDIDHICGTPSQINMSLLNAKFRSLNFRKIVLGGEYVSKKLLDTLKLEFPEASITYSYASTELGVIAYVSDMLEGIPERKIHEAQPHLSPVVKPNGELILVDKNLNKEHATGDLFERRDGRLHFLGRLNSTVSVGGETVYLKRIESKILANCDFVHEIYVYSEQNSMLGNCVVADVVLKSGFYPKDLLQKTRSFLKRSEQPIKVRAVDKLDLSNSGKKK